MKSNHRQESHSESSISEENTVQHTDTSYSNKRMLTDWSRQDMTVMFMATLLIIMGFGLNDWIN
jgi:hypothetical protein